MLSAPLMSTNGARSSAIANPRNSSRSNRLRLLLSTTPLHDQKTGVDHIALEVEDTDDAYAEGKHAGIDFLFEPLTNVQSGRRIVNMLDPDGVQMQFAKSVQRGEYKDWG